MKWYYCCKRQPEDNAVIVQVDMPYAVYYNQECTTHYRMQMKQYKISEQNCPLQLFWWCYAKDFPFPKKEDL